MGSCYHPAVSDEGPPTDVSTPNLEAGLPWPLTLGGHGPTNNATGGALEATVWGWGQVVGWTEEEGKGRSRQTERKGKGKRWRDREQENNGGGEIIKTQVRGQRVG